MAQGDRKEPFSEQLVWTAVVLAAKLCETLPAAMGWVGGGRDSLRDQQLLQWTDYNVFMITKYCLSTKYRVQLYDNMPWKAPKKSIFYKDKAKHCQPDEIIKIFIRQLGCLSLRWKFHRMMELLYTRPLVSELSHSGPTILCPPCSSAKWE